LSVLDFPGTRTRSCEPWESILEKIDTSRKMGSAKEGVQEFKKLQEFRNPL
jgi:hypothetical protein